MKSGQFGTLAALLGYWCWWRASRRVKWWRTRLPTRGRWNWKFIFCGEVINSFSAEVLNNKMETSPVTQDPSSKQLQQVWKHSPALNLQNIWSSCHNPTFRQHAEYPRSSEKLVSTHWLLVNEPQCGHLSCPAVCSLKLWSHWRRLAHCYLCRSLHVKWFIEINNIKGILR